MKNLAEFDNSYPAFSEMKLSDKDMNLLAGGACDAGCYKQCTTQKKTQEVKIACVVLKIGCLNKKVTKAR
jgi:natural product precursor